MLGNPAALKLRPTAKPRENHLAGKRAGVHFFREGNEINPEGLERFQRPEHCAPRYVPQLVHHPACIKPYGLIHANPNPVFTSTGAI
jgi:hypothetical protein